MIASLRYLLFVGIASIIGTAANLAWYFYYHHRIRRWR